jgi:hypothetical protein
MLQLRIGKSAGTPKKIFAKINFLSHCRLLIINLITAQVPYGSGPVNGSTIHPQQQ